jgi:hypothetical protein
MNSPLFIQLLERLLNQKLQKFKHKELNSDTADELYFSIKEAVFDLFKKCDFDLTEKSKLFVTSKLFRGLTFNGKEDLLAEHFHSRNADIKQLPEDDLRLLKQLMVASAMEEDIDNELKRRSY